MNKKHLFCSHKRNAKNIFIMKRLIIIFTALLTLTATAGAMSYEQAREQALFLTDKMAYELNLTEEQYDAAYEINLDYLMSVNTPDDLYATYWTQRNLDLSYILLDWQYRAFCAATYFYKPLYWTAGVWHFAIYSRYPHRNYFYFGRPRIYITYRGGHSWRHNGGRSWYKGRTFHHGSGVRGHGLRDRFDRGDFHHKGNGGGRHFKGNHGNRPNTGVGNKPQGHRYDKNRPQSNFRGNRGNLRKHRESSTRATVRTKNNSLKSANSNVSRRSIGGSVQRKPSNTFTPKRSTQRTAINRNNTVKRSVGSASRSRSSRSTPARGGGGNHRGGNARQR